MIFKGMLSAKTVKKSMFCLNILIILFLLPISLLEASYLSAKGSKLYNDKGKVVRLTGVNWFGFETSNLGPHGLWARDYHGMLLQVKNMGFNCVRIPFCNSMLRAGAEVRSINFYGNDPFYKRDMTEMNKELEGLSPIEIMDEIIRYAGEIGLAIMLDNHSREPDGYMEERLWYTAKTSQQQWIDDWVMLASRYKNNQTVIAFDLNNEPHGKIKDGGASWGIGDPVSDWNTDAQKCGNAILAVNPDVLIIIEGVEQVESTMYWWGGNLRGVKTHPIVLTKPEKLVYSPHEYGPEVFRQPWFDEPNFPDNMQAIWDDAFGFIAKQDIAPLFVGEFGINDSKSYGGKAGVWFTTFLKYMAKYSYSWTFWALNPNSGDTGGMLKYDWVTVEQWKLDLLKEWCAPLIYESTGNKRNAGRISVRRTSLTIADDVISLSRNDLKNIRLDIVNLQGKVIRSSVRSSVSIDNMPRGVFTALLYDNNRLVESVQFTSF